MRYSKFETIKQQSHIGDSNNIRKKGSKLHRTIKQHRKKGSKLHRKIKQHQKRREQVTSEIRTTTEGGRAV